MGVTLLLLVIGGGWAIMHLLKRLDLLQARVQFLEHLLARLQVRVEALDGAGTSAARADAAPPPPQMDVPPSFPAPRVLPRPSLAQRLGPAAVASTTGVDAYVPALGQMPAPNAAAPVPTPPPAQAAPPSRTRQEWEAFVGGKVLNRIGALAVIVGVAFFLKYAFDSGWVSRAVQVSIGGLIGLGFLAAGMRFQRRGLSIFAQGLAGVGISTLYLSVYAAFNLYHLIPQGVALLLMSCVTVVAFAQALSYDSLAVALLAWAGGFLTPPLLSTGTANELGLFSYIALLAAGLVAVVARKGRPWAVLHVLTFAATFMTYLGWYFEYYLITDFWLTVTFLSIFWAIFFVADLAQLLRSRQELPMLQQVVSLLNTIFPYGLLALLVAQRYPGQLAPLTLGFGLAYFGAILLLTRRGVATERISSQYLLTALGCLALATFQQFEGYTLAMLWALEAVALLAALVVWRRALVFLAVATLFQLAALALLAATVRYFPNPATFVPLLSERTLAYLVVAGAVGGGALLARRVDHRDRPWVEQALHYGWCLLALLLLTLETNDWSRITLAPYEHHPLLSMLLQEALLLPLAWCTYALVFGQIARRAALLPALSSAMLALAMAVLFTMLQGFVFTPIVEFVPLLNTRVLVFHLVAAALLSFGGSLAQHRPRLTLLRELQLLLACGFVALLVELPLAEIVDFFRSDLYGYNASLLLALTVLGYGLAASAAGGWLKNKPVAIVGAAWLVIGALLAARLGRHHPEPGYLPLANWRAATLLLVAAGLLLYARWLRRLPAQPWTPHARFALQLGAAVLGFELLTAEIVDLFNRLTLQHWDDNALYSYFRNMKQLSLSGGWVLYALGAIVVGFAAKLPWLRLAAIGLFGLTILKVFLLDLSFLQQPYRIISFILLGLILLGVSYLYQRFKALILESALLPA